MLRLLHPFCPWTWPGMERWQWPPGRPGGFQTRWGRAAAQRLFSWSSRQIKNLLTGHSFGGGFFLPPQGGCSVGRRSDSGRPGLLELSRRGNLKEWIEKGPNPEEIGRQGVGVKCSPGHWEKRNLKVREWGKVPLPASLWKELGYREGRESLKEGEKGNETWQRAEEILVGPGLFEGTWAGKGAASFRTVETWKPIAWNSQRGRAKRPIKGGTNWFPKEQHHFLQAPSPVLLNLPWRQRVTSEEAPGGVFVLGHSAACPTPTPCTWAVASRCTCPSFAGWPGGMGGCLCMWKATNPSTSVFRSTWHIGWWFSYTLLRPQRPAPRGVK